jgi:molybdopterin biosynthesis enzyme
VAPGDDGWHVEPTKAQGSHVLTSMLGAGALALLPAGDGTLEPGARVVAELLQPGTLSA